MRPHGGEKTVRRREQRSYGIDVRVRALSLLLILPTAAFLADAVVLALIGTLTVVVVALGTGWKPFWRAARSYFLLSTFSFVLLSILFNEQRLADRVLAGLVVAVRFNILISLGVLYALTTNPNEIPQALVRMHIPHRYGMLVMVGFRLYPLILQKMRTILESAKARGLDMSLSLTSTRLISNLGLVLPSLLLTSLEVGVHLGETMLARGYNPDHPITISPNVRLKITDYLCLVGSTALLLMSTVAPLTA